MKFSKFEHCSLNEAFFNKNMDAEVDEKIVGTASVVYADAVNQHKAIEKKLEDDFKEVIANADEFVDDNHNREKKGNTTMEMKKMHLSEELFEDVKVESPAVEEEEIVVKTTETSTETLTEAFDFGDPADMGRGACTPLAPDFAKGIEQYATYLPKCDPRERDMIVHSLARFAEGLFDAKDKVESFNTYWTARYPVMMEYINSQIDMIPQEVLDGKSMQEDTDPHFFKDDTVEEAVEAEEPVKKRTRGPNEKPAIQDLSSEDLWYAVYDELSATTDQEGEGKAVNKQLKARRGERYENVYPHGDNDIIVYAHDEGDFEFAKQVCDHYGVKYDEPKHQPTASTKYYPWSMIIYIPEDELYTTDIDDVM